MTKAEAIAAHRKMWRWIADETARRKCVVDKSDYFEAMGIPEEDRPSARCYCCEYDKDNGDNNCALCPIEWPTGHCCGGGLYSRWTDTFDYCDWITAAEIARRIAELPEKEDENDE